MLSFSFNRSVKSATLTDRVNGNFGSQTADRYHVDNFNWLVKIADNFNRWVKMRNYCLFPEIEKKKNILKSIIRGRTVVYYYESKKFRSVNIFSDVPWCLEFLTTVFIPDHLFKGCLWPW